MLENDDPDYTTLYYFPVLLEGKVVGTYRMFEDEDDWGYVFSPDALVEELNNIADETTPDAPAVIYLDANRDIVIQTQTSTQVIEDDPTITRVRTAARKYSTELAKQYAASSMRVSANILEDTSNGTRGITNFRPVGQSVQLTPIIHETQGSLPWCTGYVIALITSYRTGTKYTAANVAAYAGSNTTPPQAISMESGRDFAKSKGLSKTKLPLVQGVMNNSSIMDQIDAGCPVFAGAFDIGGGLFDGHAFAIIGYKARAILNENAEWTIWNPWYNDFAKIGQNRRYTAKDGTAFRAWYIFIKDYKK